MSLTSIGDPEIGGITSNCNATVDYFDSFIAASTVGLYTRYRVNFVVVTVRAMANVSGNITNAMISTTANGNLNYPVSGFGYLYQSRPHTYSMKLEYLGDTSYKSKKFVLYPNAIIGISKDQYFSSSEYIRAWNYTDSVTPASMATAQLVFTVADGLDAISAGSAIF